jgi:hypothetical protein
MSIDARDSARNELMGEEDLSFPFIPDDLLEELDRIYPEVNPPSTEATLADIWRAVGTRQVILLLKHHKQLELERRASDVYRG